MQRISLLFIFMFISYQITLYGDAESIKLYAFYTPSHTELLEKWFLPTLQDDYEIILENYEQECPQAEYMTKGWLQTMVHKVEIIIRGIQENWGKVFIHSDVDIQFFRPTKEFILEQIKDKDMVIQHDRMGMVCAGFFACRGNEKTLALWEAVRKRLLLPGNSKHDQGWLDYYLRFDNCFDIVWDYLPDSFMGGGTITGKFWFPGREIPVPDDIYMHHANVTRGVTNKILQLQYVRDVVNQIFIIR